MHARLPRLLLTVLLAATAAAVRAQPVQVPDTLPQRLKACAACHGEQGEGLQGRNEYFPRLAGKPADYLFAQLLAFRHQRRSQSTMNAMLAPLSDAYLREIAEHYAALDPPYPPPRVLADAATLERGRRLVREGNPGRALPACAACHGSALAGLLPAIPGLLGLNPPYVTAQLGAWKTGHRRALDPDCMRDVAHRLDAQDVSAITAYLAAQPVPRDAKPAPPSTQRLPLACGTAAAADATTSADRRTAAGPRSELERRGAYLATVGNCIGCHTAPGGEPFAGGLAITTPFGRFFTPNITPHASVGIGAWSADDFWRAMHEGRGRDGRALYPAFPYTNYTRVTRADSDAIHAYLRTLPPAAATNRAHELDWPYRWRPLLALWRLLYFRPGVHRDDPARDARGNRGAYLVEGLGHCSACHAPRNALGAVVAQGSGGLMPMRHWFAPSLARSGVQETQAELVELLRNGVAPRASMSGPMAAVVRSSLQALTDEDVDAMAAYLRSLPAPPRAAESTAPRGADERGLARAADLGARVYRDHCAACHGEHGQGAPRIYPPLSGNAAVSSAPPANLLRLVLQGGFPPSTPGHPRPYGMPPFYAQLSDEEIAAVITHVRRAWGGQGSPVGALDVQRARGAAVD